MKTVGFIDYYLDNFHSNNYPKWIKEASDGEIEAKYAWAKIDSPSGVTTKEWCEKNNIKHIDSIEELVEISDYIIVLAPDNPEVHEELCQIPLRSGKRIYVDKSFAPNREIAKRLFNIAEENNTPMFTSSALRFSDELKEINKDNIDFIMSAGPGEADSYLIHQAEPIVSLMGYESKRIMSIGTKITPSWVIEFSDGRKATMSLFGWDCPFSLKINKEQRQLIDIDITTEYFIRFVENMVDFFRTGQVKVDKKETLAVMSICQKARECIDNTGVWYELD